MSVCLFLLLELEPGFVLVYPVHFLLTLLLSFYVFVDIVNGRFFFFLVAFSNRILLVYMRALDFYTLISYWKGNMLSSSFFFGGFVPKVRLT